MTHHPRICKISRKVFLGKYPTFVHSKRNGDEYVGPEIFSSYILYIDAGSTQGKCNKLSRELAKLLTLLNYTEMNFLGESSIPWLYREHDYRPVKQALTYLSDNEISKSFNGAIKISIENLPEFIKSLFWLVRCNGVVMYVNFSDNGFNFTGSICQYGNLHISTLDEKTDAAFRNAVNKTAFKFLEDERCSAGPIYRRRAVF